MAPKRDSRRFTIDIITDEGEIKEMYGLERGFFINDGMMLVIEPDKGERTFDSLLRDETTVAVDNLGQKYLVTRMH